MPGIVPAKARQIRVWRSFVVCVCVWCVTVCFPAVGRFIPDSFIDTEAQRRVIMPCASNPGSTRSCAVACVRLVYGWLLAL